MESIRDRSTRSVCWSQSPKDDWTGFRAAFNAAHEYAHWLLRDLTVEEFGVWSDGEENHIEVRANAFAAAFLMPKEGIAAYFTGLGLLKEGRSLI